MTILFLQKLIEDSNALILVSLHLRLGSLCSPALSPQCLSILVARWDSMRLGGALYLTISAPDKESREDTTFVLKQRGRASVGNRKLGSRHPLCHCNWLASVSPSVKWG